MKNMKMWPARAQFSLIVSRQLCTSLSQTLALRYEPLFWMICRFWKNGNKGSKQNTASEYHTGLYVTLHLFLFFSWRLRLFD